jgi:hypothetical protein
MLRRLFCCFNKTNPHNLNPHNPNPHNPNLHNPNEIIKPQKIDTKPKDICIRITADCIENSQISLLDTTSLYDSTEWLNKIVKPIDWNDCEPFVPPIDRGIVIKVYDGDTITIASRLPYQDSPLYRFSVRLNGIDCPEIKGTNSFEKECAQIAKQVMTELVLNKLVILKNIKTEKYGRILADVYIDELYINEHMLEKRLAISYDGGKKDSPKNWMEYYSKGIN